MSEARLRYYDQAVISCVQQSVQSGHYPQFEMVLRKILHQFGVPSLQHLGFCQLPSLDLLYDIQQKVNAFLNAYVGTQSVVCLCDMEVELCVMLRSFNIPVEYFSRPLDPNEVEIDQNESQNFTDISFDQFGLGPLRLNPLVIRILSPICNERSFADFSNVSTADIIARLEEFVSCNSAHGFNNVNSGREKFKFNLEQFQDFVCKHYKVSHLSCIGVLIKGKMEAELLMIRHVMSIRERLLLKMQKEYFEKSEHVYSNSTPDQAGMSIANHEKDEGLHDIADAASMQSVEALKFRLNPPHRSKTVSFLNKFEKLYSSPYSPSFGKAQSVLEKLWKQAGHSANYNLQSDLPSLLLCESENPVGHKKKRRKQNSNAHTTTQSENVCQVELTEIEKEFICVATEYVMLHVGGSKYRKKRFYVEHPTAQEESCPKESNSHSFEKTMLSSGEFPGDNACEDDLGRSISTENKVANFSRVKENASCQLHSIFPVAGDDALLTSQPKSTQDVHNIYKIRDIPFEGKITKVISRDDHIAVESIEVSSFLPWCRSNSLSQNTSKVEHLRAIGRWGESLVYQYLLYQFPDKQVTWLNEKEETNASYDLKLEQKNNKNELLKNGTTFIEVKSTQFSDKNVFHISKSEWDFIVSLPRVSYDIYRVYNAGNGDKVRLEVYHDVYKLIDNRKMQLCLAV